MSVCDAAGLSLSPGPGEGRHLGRHPVGPHSHGRLLLVRVAEEQRTQTASQLVLLELARSVSFAVVLAEDQRQT